MSMIPVEELTPVPVGTGEDSMQQFMQDIREYPLLSAQQEMELAKRCAQGDEEAIRLMVTSNIRLVVSVAREYANWGVPLLDLIQEGCIGLLAAAKKYDYTKNCRFATYAALWIRQGVKRYLDNQSGLIRVPAHTAEQIRRITAVQTMLSQTTGQEPTVDQIALESGMDIEKVIQLQQLQPSTCSLDAIAGEQDAMGTLVEDLHSPQPQQLLVRQALIQTMEKLLSMLSQREQQVLRLHFGMEDGTNYSLAQISGQLGISKERVRQIEKQAMERLKELGADMGLEDFLE